MNEYHDFVLRLVTILVGAALLVTGALAGRHKTTVPFWLVGFFGAMCIIAGTTYKAAS